MRLMPIVLVVGLVLSLTSAHADPYVTDPTTGCKLWGGDTGEDVSKDIVSWSGSCEKGFASGSGVLSWFAEGCLWARYEGAMKKGKAGRFGLGYNAVVWAELRQFAVEFLKEARDTLDDDLEPLFERAIAHYETVAQCLKAVSEAYPFKDCDDEKVKVDDNARVTIDALQQARAAEAAGLDVLTELATKVDG